MERIDEKNLLFSRRALISLAVPMVLENILAIITGTVDSVMVSSAGDAAVSAVSLVDSINLLFICVFFALTTGGVVVTAQYIGRKNFEEARNSARQLVWFATGLAAVFMAVLLAFIPQILKMLYGGIAPDVFADAEKYFFWTLLGYPFLAIGNSCCALLRTMAKSKISFYLVSGANVVNVIGNAVLIYGFKLGAAGAAIATTFSRIVWAAVGIMILSNRGLPVYFEKLFKIKIDLPMLRRVLAIGVPNGIENGLFQVGKLLISSLLATFGTVSIAAYSVANSISNIGWTIIGAFSNVLLTVVGQCMGAGEKEQAKYYTKKVTNIATVLCVVIFASLFLLRRQIVTIYRVDSQTLDLAAYFVGVSAVLTMASYYSMSFLPVAAFRAAGDTKYAVILAVASMFTFRVAGAYIIEWIFHLGQMSIWIGMSLDWGCRSICNIFRFRSGKWLQKKVI